MLQKPIIILFLSLLVFSLKPKPSNDKAAIQHHLKEKYNPALYSQLQSISDIINYVDSAAGSNNRQSVKYAEHLENTISNRFYHAYSHYAFYENPIAASAGKLFWDHLSAVVLPEDILKYPMAACSQQSIVLMKCFEEIGIDYRKVGFVGHYALEANIDGKWYFFDANKEPIFTNGRKSIQELINTKEVYTIYANSMSANAVKTMTNKVAYGQANAAPAPNASLFHQASNILVILLLTALLYFSINYLYRKTFS